MRSEERDGAIIEHWTPGEVSEAFARSEIALIDVRTPQEYMFEHIEGALLAPMSFFRPANLPSQEGKPIVFLCGSGVRSGRVAQLCIAAGARKVAHMEGGFAAWKKAGLPYMGTEMSTGAPKRMAQTPGQAPG